MTGNEYKVFVAIQRKDKIKPTEISNYLCMSIHTIKSILKALKRKEFITSTNGQYSILRAQTTVNQSLQDNFERESIFDLFKYGDAGQTIGDVQQIILADGTNALVTRDKPRFTISEMCKATRG